MRHDKQNINNNLGNWTRFKLKRGRDRAQLNNYNVIEREHHVEGYEHSFLKGPPSVQFDKYPYEIGTQKQDIKKRT